MTPLDANECAVRASLREGDTQAGVRATLALHGPELFGFLCAVLDDRETATRVYADVVHRITTELGELRWRCSLRTWTYWIARRELQDRRRRGAPAQPGVGEADPEVTESNRPAGTLRLRGNLAEEDREILILRVDRGLGWNELAMTALGQEASKEALEREAGKLRRQVDRIVSEIHQGAPDRGGPRRPGGTSDGGEIR